MSKQRKAANRLSARIDKLIEETIAKVNSQNAQQETAGTNSEKQGRDANALENQEKKTMEKVNEQKVRQQPKRRSDKDW